MIVCPKTVAITGTAVQQSIFLVIAKRLTIVGDVFTSPVLPLEILARTFRIYSLFQLAGHEPAIMQTVIARMKKILFLM